MHDAVIIGGGPAGYTAATRISQLGGTAVIVEKEALGGVCANWGCIPTKALEASVRTLENARKAGAMGVKTSQVEPDFPAMIQRMNRVKKASVAGIHSLIRSSGIEVVEAEGKLVSPTQVKTGKKTLKAKNVLIATGSFPIAVPGVRPDGKNILNSKQALELEKVPSSMAIIGGGFVGVEFANIFQKLGCDVTIIEFFSQLLPAEDPEISGLLLKALQRNGVSVMTDSKAVSIQKKQEGVQIEVNTPTGQQVRTVGKVLVAIGRRPNVLPRQLSKIGVKASKKGIHVDNHLRTSCPTVFAAGDVTGQNLLAHVAFRQGEVAAENIMGLNTEIDYSAVPNCVFSSPEVASVGLKESQVSKARVGKCFFAANGKAKAEGKSQGLMKVVFDSKTDKLVGAQAIGLHASDLIAEAVLAVKMDATSKQLKQVIHAHPTLPEVFLEAVKNAG
jgi:dihydrolipoamide dehydrogenase